MADDKRTKSPEKPKVAKMDFFSSGEEEEPEPDTGETKELLIEDRAAVVGVILIVQSKYASICLLESQLKEGNSCCRFHIQHVQFPVSGSFSI